MSHVSNLSTETKLYFGYSIHTEISCNDPANCVVHTLQCKISPISPQKLIHLMRVSIFLYSHTCGRQKCKPNILPGQHKTRTTTITWSAHKTIFRSNFIIPFRLRSQANSQFFTRSNYLRLLLGFFSLSLSQSFVLFYFIRYCWSLDEKSHHISVGLEQKS